MKTKVKIILAASAFLIICLFAFIPFFFCSEAASIEGFDKIAVGMTEHDVRNILGDPGPNQVHHDSHGRIRYFYGGFPKFKWCSMEIFFEENCRVTGKFHDH